MARTVVKERLPFSPRPNRAAEIRWHPWGSEVFRTAQRGNKPILLAITARWCEECHRMDETSYSDQSIIDTLNSDYVCLRLDADRRPDVDERYTQGGWPSTVLLAPSGEPLTGGTYLPPEQLLPLLKRVTDWYQTNLDLLRQEIADVEARRRQLLTCLAMPAREPSRELLAEVADRLRSLYDPNHGGFGNRPKFPHAEAVRFALEQSRLRGGEAWEEIATRSLEAIAGHLLDPVEGGFFRCADESDWTGLHTEKTLETNADLLQLYLQAYQTTGSATYRTVAERILAYLATTLYNPDNSTFRGSQAADPAYYRLDEWERQATPSPQVDRTVFADTNARAAIAYLDAYEILGDAGRLRTATELLDFLWRELGSTTHGLRHYWDGRAGGPYLLRDQVWVATALAEGYDATGDPKLLERSALLAEVILRDYPGNPGGFYDIRAERQPLGGLANRQSSLVENAQVAQLMARLGQLSANGRYQEAARSSLQLFADDYDRYGALEAAYARALEAYLRGKT